MHNKWQYYSELVCENLCRKKIMPCAILDRTFGALLNQVDHNNLIIKIAAKQNQH
jgi:hypothetical protein